MKGINIDAVASDSDLGRGWFMYTDLARAVSPTSTEAERVFSTLSRLRSKFRRNLHLHLSACVRVSQAKTLGCGIDGEDIIDEILKDWSLVKLRRRRPIGLATGPHRMSQRGATLICIPTTGCDSV